MGRQGKAYCENSAGDWTQADISVRTADFESAVKDADAPKAGYVAYAHAYAATFKARNTMGSFAPHRGLRGKFCLVLEAGILTKHS